MALNIGKEMTALKRMTVPELRRKYAAVFREDTTSRHKEFLIRLTLCKTSSITHSSQAQCFDRATRSRVSGI